MTGGPQARTLRTKERILTAAIDLFLENGFHGTNIDSVAALSRSSKQTIYKYYEDKEEILEHAIAHLRDEISERSLKINFDASNYKTEFARFGLVYLETMLRSRQVKTFRLCVEMARKKSKLAAAFGKIESEKLHTVLAEYIEYLGSNDLIPLDDDPEFMAEAFLVMVRGNFQLFRAIDEEYAPTQQELFRHVDRVTRLFCAALERPAVNQV